MRNLIKASDAVTILFDIAFEWTKNMDELRDVRNVPDPATIGDVLSNAASWVYEGIIGEGESIQLETGFQMSVQEAMRQRNRPWFDAWDAKGWLDSNPERNPMSHCDINPYCWASMAVGMYLALVDAIIELRDACYDKKVGSPRPYGKVASRNAQIFRGIGRPIKDKDGRHSKEVRRQKAEKKALAEGRQPGQVGRPKKKVFPGTRVNGVVQDDSGRPPSKQKAYVNRYQRKYRRTHPRND